MPDNYEQLADRYQASDLKPDKRFSILPTVLVMAGDSHGKTVLDLGCGSGFFTRAFATAGAKHVIGLDSSVRQIEIARKIASSPTIEYRVADVFQDSLPPANIICCPFLLNQFSSVTVLATFLTKLHATLPDHGRVLFVVDFPTARDLKSYGARKILHGEPKDATPMTTELYAASAELICELHVFYRSEEHTSELQS